MRAAELPAREAAARVVLVTGSGGLLGRTVVGAFARRGVRVLAGARRTTARSPAGAVPLHLDVRDREAVLESVARCDAVVHLAARVGVDACVREPVDAIETNVRGTLHVLDAARVWKKPVVYASVPNVADTNPYAVTKATGERFCAMYRNEHGVRVHVLRVYNTYGPGQDEASGKLLARNVARALRGEELVCHGGDQREDFLHVDDAAFAVVEATCALLAGGLAPELPSEVGTGVGTSIREVLTLVAELAGNDVAVRVEPRRAGTRGDSVVATRPSFVPPSGHVLLRDGIASWMRASRGAP